ncbi:MAG: hypothetical protein RLZZ360_949 [Candidatus Parcubacteria bacterium]|jgi:hypothetical protein
MSAIDNLKVRIEAEQNALDEELKAMLVQAMLRWKQIQQELRGVVGMDYLPPAPDAELFINTLRTIMSLVDGREWDVLKSLGFDGVTAKAWLEFEVESAPKINGREILELIFGRASALFGDVGVYDWLQSKSQDVDEIIRDVEARVAEASGLSPKERITLKTRLRAIEGLSSRIRYQLSHSFPYLGDVLLETEAGVLREPNVGRKSLNELKEFLRRNGFRLSADGEKRKADPEFEEFLDWRAQQGA